MINDSEKKVNEQMVIVRILIKLLEIQVIAILIYMERIQEWNLLDQEENNAHRTKILSSSLTFHPEKYITWYLIFSRVGTIGATSTCFLSLLITKCLK